MVVKFGFVVLMVGVMAAPVFGQSFYGINFVPVDYEKEMRRHLTSFQQFRSEILGEAEREIQIVEASLEALNNDRTLSAADRYAIAIAEQINQPYSGDASASK